ncbi:hypothetical protein AMTRI_Chr12g234120 [Amborella trichopoda]|uniref:AP2/ERF domain-containing protein n=1 Tax=Amborella trichopoda TaxID=13333 RepID=W1PET2_AMBTC|nr:ethylene-responsive transcription factor ERF017 [Amborella trichopoda]ERN05580.1 hypothetical protein AMTR_s00007p00268280 [Amborella trichopoda]|eukprot:XP_006843905.1 ethylene-responsive transcription factor ERF017 [Amborella trichopoda]
MVKSSTGAMAASTSRKTDCSGYNGSKFKGIRKRKWGKWVSEVRLPNSRERIWLGSYDTAEKAARAYDAAVFCLRGPTAHFNFPANHPKIQSSGRLTADEIRAVAAQFANEAPAPTSTSTSTVKDPPESPVESEQTVQESDSNWSFIESLLSDSSNSGFSGVDFNFPCPLLDDFPSENLTFPAVDYDGFEDSAFSDDSLLWSF